MSSVTDVYADWDAAYVLGALSPRERHAFEQHLETCPRCTTAVAELAGLTGLLARVPEHEVLAAHPREAREAPDAETAVSRRPRRPRRLRRVVVAACVIAAATATVLVIAVGGLGAGSAPPAAAETVRLVSTGQTALSADVRLDAETWGTSLTTHCRYGAAAAEGGRYGGEEPGSSSPPEPSGAGTSHRYGLYVTDRAGRSSLVSSWSAAPGTDVQADGSTDLPLESIAGLDIRAIDTGSVLLRSPVGSTTGPAD